MPISQLEISNHDRPLAQDITTATRSVHANLNKQIIARLPLALPPRAADPTAYISGLLHIAPIYIAFEALWRDIVELPASKLVNHDTVDSIANNPSYIPVLDHGADHKTAANVCSRMQALLSDLYLPDLMRTGRLKEDIRRLSGWPSHVVEEQLEAISQTGRLSDFISHIKRAAQQKPHILLAYSYIMFMALFAGGRFIRASLEAAGDEFWRSAPSPTKLSPPTQRDGKSASATDAQCGQASHHEQANDDTTSSTLHDSPFCFFHFSTPNDGEDLKLEFKSRLSRAEGTLTERERRDIVQEAVCIFDNMRLLVQQLDTVCAGPEGEVENDDLMEFTSQLLNNPLGTRFRDSLAVTKERAARSSSKWSSSSDETAKYDSTIDRKGFVPLTSNHPLSSGGLDFKMCPATAKSMRFEETSPRALRFQKSSEDLRSHFASGAKSAARSVYSMGFTNIVVALAFAVVFICALLSRRSVLEVPLVG